MQIQNTIQIILLILILISVNKNLIKKSKLILKRTVVVTTWYLSKLYPKTKNLVVFGAENGRGFRGNPKYLFLEMVKNPELTCVWISKDPNVVSELTEKGYLAFKYKSLKGILYQLRAKLVIHSHSINDDFYKVLLGGAISYNTWHGVGLKKVWGANKNTFTYKILHEKSFIKRFFGKFVVKTNSAKTNYVVSTSEKVSSYYPETYLVPKENVLELGQVRNDIFFSESEEDADVPTFLKENKIITYMPTHRSFGKIDTDINLVFDFQELDQFCEKTGYIFVIKRHMYSSGYIPKQYKHIIDISEENIDPQFLLKYTDILLTDYSSCYTDFLLLDRPVAFYCYDLETYLKKSNEMYHGYFDVTPGPKTRNFAELMQSLEEYVKDPTLYQDERNRVLNVFYSSGNQGKVLEKQVTYLYKNILKI
ncbi:CDP-glycerol glycerophosphotransferase family protein [Heyndrickxia sporothermodurans]|uniref:CDP-glycerol glycerophosphotransferase family protein n=3 Tax=Heyndrickxia sporothermodurans TaxID=46224 RepID=A0A150LH50_9BACI|nr:CDP-glycerol glycerophosphotransferase family protein [Heyndrickxia sporothermodurans]KYD11349.1 CDP-glycerol:poly(glycerophosphate) glycerophosphotransferase [Heyndrickxia sporothermodurans]MBL5766214.1 CDP-glycerol glycerophosphotransferase family protein [Heyndrickxia sporothermodurans]MBL5769654.1 CDP-glycerol glycerophosphotransferase family protein [Heyndrickxia sporothermodurans]MBL5773550.1 CDP-glycerol glycerophosphotransferase family protein [Heyndrickxia sporothermodurans]MBL5776